MIYLPKVLWQERYFGRWWFSVVFASDHKYYGQISIKLSTQALNYTMQLLTFIESLLIAIHWVKIFQLSLCIFTWNRPSSTQKFKLRCSAWLVSMEICPKGISISIWHLFGQIKIHTENMAWYLRIIFKRIFLLFYVKDLLTTGKNFWKTANSIQRVSLQIHFK